ncbi:MAG: RsmD family RNA methyltransferase, partial [Pseudohongiellaceae bacterium]
SNLQSLCENNWQFTCINSAAHTWLKTRHQRDTFDIVFLDPPFGGSDIPSLLRELVKGEVMAHGALCYIESPAAIEPGDLPQGFTKKKQKRAGRVHFCLCQYDR